MSDMERKTGLYSDGTGENIDWNKTLLELWNKPGKSKWASVTIPKYSRSFWRRLRWERFWEKFWFKLECLFTKDD